MSVRKLPISDSSGMRVHDRIAFAMKEFNGGISARALSQRVNLSPKSIELMLRAPENGGTRRSGYFNEVADALGVSRRWLVDGVGHPLDGYEGESIRWLPVMLNDGTLNRGGARPVPGWEGTAIPEEAFLWIVPDRSMEPFVPENAAIIIDPDASPEPGEPVVSAIQKDGCEPQLVMRRWFDRDSHVELQPENSAYASYQLPAEQVQIKGRIIAIWQPFTPRWWIGG